MVAEAVAVDPDVVVAGSRVPHVVRSVVLGELVAEEHAVLPDGVVPTCRRVAEVVDGEAGGCPLTNVGATEDDVVFDNGLESARNVDADMAGVDDHVLHDADMASAKVASAVAEDDCGTGFARAAVAHVVAPNDDRNFSGSGRGEQVDHVLEVAVPRAATLDAVPRDPDAFDATCPADLHCVSPGTVEVVPVDDDIARLAARDEDCAVAEVVSSGAGVGAHVADLVVVELHAGAVVYVNEVVVARQFRRVVDQQRVRDDDACRVLDPDDLVLIDRAVRVVCTVAKGDVADPDVLRANERQARPSGVGDDHVLQNEVFLTIEVLEANGSTVGDAAVLPVVSCFRKGGDWVSRCGCRGEARLAGCADVVLGVAVARQGFELVIASSLARTVVPGAEQFDRRCFSLELDVVDMDAIDGHGTVTVVDRRIVHEVEGKRLASDRARCCEVVLPKRGCHREGLDGLAVDS